MKTKENSIIMISQKVNCKISEDNGASQKCFYPKRAPFRYLGLVLMCFLCFGAYFCYDNPGALQDKIETILDIPTSKFVLLYSVYSWPNVILCFIGGFLLDRIFGIRWGTIIYATLTLFGHLLFALGTYVNIFWLMVLGRFVYGSGAESLMVAQKNYAVIWFKGNALNMLFGLQLSLAKVGSTVNSLTLEHMYRGVSDIWNGTGSQRIGIVFFISALTCFISMICALLLGLMDSRAEKVLNRNQVAKPVLVKLTDVKDFKMTFWFIVLICLSYYVAIVPFISLGKLFFMTKYQYEPDEANTVVSLVYSISAVISPLIGIAVDKTGRNIVWVLISIIGSSIAHSLLAFTYISPYVCMVILGASYSIFANSLWSMIALVIPEHQLGTAYGTTCALYNLNLAVMSIVCGIIVDSYGYFWLELFFLAWLLITLVPAIVIWKCNSMSIDKT